MITLIAAMDQNGGIGRDNQLVWHIPEDLKRFKELTSGNIVVMGRKTFESLKKPLPNRTNVVLTNNWDWDHPDVVTNMSVDHVMEWAPHTDKEIFIIGGAQIYEQFFSYADRLLFTFIEEEYEVDTYFPRIPPTEWRHWRMVKNERIEADGKTPAYTFVEWQRVSRESE